MYLGMEIVRPGLNLRSRFHRGSSRPVSSSRIKIKLRNASRALPADSVAQHRVWLGKS